MTTFALERHDGGVEIMQLIDETSDPSKELAKWPAERQVEIRGFREIDPNDIPADRTHRDAWKHDFTVDTVKVAAINLEKRRDQAVADAKLADLKKIRDAVK